MLLDLGDEAGHGVGDARSLQRLLSAGKERGRGPLGPQGVRIVLGLPRTAAHPMHPAGAQGVSSRSCSTGGVPSCQGRALPKRTNSP